MSRPRLSVTTYDPDLLSKFREAYEQGDYLRVIALCCRKFKPDFNLVLLRLVPVLFFGLCSQSQRSSQVQSE